MSEDKSLEGNTQHPDILHQAGISLPQEFDANATDGDGDGTVQDGSQWERPAVAPSAPIAFAVEPETLPVVVADPDPVAEEAAPKKSKGKKSASTAFVPTNLGDGTAVYMSKMVYQSAFEQNSNSVRSVQTRLIELGYITAGDDKQGWISTATAEALENFKNDNDLEVGMLDEELVKALFEGTSVKVLP
jgi:hypothetical protein